MNNIIKTAIIGCGNISYNHLVALKPLENIKITALCDIIPERAEKRKAEFSLSDAKIYTSFKSFNNAFSFWLLLCSRYFKSTDL